MTAADASAAAAAAAAASVSASMSAHGSMGSTPPRGDAPPITDSWLPTVQEPPVEPLARQFLLRLNLPYAIGTRVPGPDDPDQNAYQQVTINGFVRIEQIGITQVNELEFDCDWALHAYHPDWKASQRINSRATSYAANAQGTKVNVPEYTEDDGTVVPAADWYIGWSRAPIRGERQMDPTVELPRFRSMITWRVPGHVLQG